MARAKSNTELSTTYTELTIERARHMESNDCSVVALAAVSGRPYAEVRETLKKHGRRDRCGATIYIIRRAAADLGLTITDVSPRAVIDTYPAPHNNLRNVTSHHPERFAKVWPRGKFLLVTRRHILAIIDGVNHDWSKGQSLRGEFLWKVEPNSSAPI